MPTSIADKLKIKSGYALLTLHAPADFKKKLEPLPGDVKIGTGMKNYNQLHWFVSNRAQMEEELNDVLKLMKEQVLCWIYYPKGSSKLQTDLTRDKGWDELLKHKELHWISLISFDDTWSTFAFRLKTANDIKKEAKPQVRLIFDYIDAAKKTVRLPEDFEKILARNKKEKQFFEALSFSNKKEYVEWIITAKREDTRIQRLNQSIERLGKGWKNPADRN